MGHALKKIDFDRFCRWPNEISSITCTGNVSMFNTGSDGEAAHKMIKSYPTWSRNRVWNDRNDQKHFSCVQSSSEMISVTVQLFKPPPPINTYDLNFIHKLPCNNKELNNFATQACLFMNNKSANLQLVSCITLTTIHRIWTSNLRL